MPNAVFRFPLTLLLLCIFTFCHGQSFTTINYALPEGLPSAEVYEVFQDQKKFLWFATDNGVAKFDGHEMQTYNVEQGLSDPVVFGFAEDRQGRIWFRTFSGKLSYYDHADRKIYKYPHNDKLTALCHDSFLWTIHFDRAGQLWFGTNTSWGKIDSSGQVTKYPCTKQYGAFYQTVDGDKLIYGRSSCGRLENIMIEDTIFSYDLKYGQGLVHPVMTAVRWRGKLYYSLNADLFEFDGKTLRKVFTAASGIINLSLDREDHLWIGYYEGVQRYSDDRFTDPMKLPFFNDKSVTEVTQDHEGGLWISTVGKGVFYIPNFNIRNQSLTTSSPIVSATLADGAVLVSEAGGKLLVIDRNTHRIRQRKVIDSRIRAHYVDSRKNIWVAGNQSTMLFDSLLRPLTGARNPTQTFLDFHEGRNGRFYSIDKARVRIYDAQGALITYTNLKFYYRSMLPDDSLLYFTPRTGLHVYDERLRFVKDLTALADYKFSELINVNDSLLLLTSIGDGFFLLNKRTHEHVEYNTRNKFIANNIYTAITADSCIWLGTEIGIIRVPLPSLLKKDPSFSVLTQKSGLIADKVNSLLEAGDQIWAFFDHGYSAFPKNVSSSVNRNPIFYIKDLSVNNHTLKLREHTQLPYTDNNLTVNIGFIAFNNQNIFARYRLKQDNPWSYATERSLKFYSLSPGDYTFEVEYSIDNTHWQSAGVAPHFVILPPWWQTWYFQTAVALVVLLMIYVYFRNQVNTYRRHQQKLIESEIDAIESERSRIAKDLHDSVGTDFSAIKMMVSQVLQKHNEPHTEEIEAQFQGTIHEIKSIIYGLSPPGLERYGLVAGLRNYIDKISITIPVKIELNSFGPEVKDLKLSITIFRILQELISNSLKHSQATLISLHINTFEDLLNVVYEDNGKGFSWDAKHSGLGLYNIESRIQSVNGQLRFDSGAFGISYTLDIPLRKPKALS